MRTYLLGFCVACLLSSSLSLGGASFQPLPDIPVSNRIYSISTGPGEDASRAMCISWACDTTVRSSFVRLSERKDGNWADALTVEPTQNHRTDVFRGVFSTAADGSDMYEDAVFVKCGVEITSLKPDTEYKYVIVERADGVDIARSEEHYFRTAGAESWSACLISDFHSYPPLPGRLDAAMGMIDTVQDYDPSLDWIMSAGDVVAWGGSYSFWKRMFEEDNFKEFFWARVNGNHDNWTRESQVTRNFDIPNDYFKNTSYYPMNGYKGEEGVCYHFRYGNTLFVMLNTEDLDKKGELSAAQAWLRECVKAERNSPNPPTFVVVSMHYEWFLGTNGRTSQYANWSRLFDELGVDLAVAGNNHVYVRTMALYDSQVTDGRRGTVYLQTSASDNDRGRDFAQMPLQNADKIAFRWTEGAHSVSAVHMDVNRDRMVLTLLDRNGKRIDRTEIPAKANVRDDASHVVYGPWVTDMGENAFTLLWTTDVPCQGWVELEGGRKVWEEYAGRKLFGTMHTVRVEGLSRGSGYRYRIGNRVADSSNPRRPSYGQDVLSSWNTLTTFDPSRRKCHFTVFNDIHMNLDRYRSHLRDMDVADNDFLVLNGDIISAGNWPLDSLVKYEVGSLGEDGARLPVVYSRGNHEGRGSGVALLEKVFPRSKGAPYYYTFREGPAAFIVLDCGETGVANSLALTGERFYEEYLREQMEWAKAAMKEPSFKGAPVKICIIHAPMIDPGTPDDFVPHTWMNHNFVPILNEGGIDLMIGADLHERVYHPAGAMNNAFPIFVNDNHSRLDVKVEKGRVYLTVYDENNNVTVPTMEIRSRRR